MSVPYHIKGLPAFETNYLWLLHDSQNALLIDPGDADICLAALQDNQLSLNAILITHHHNDHIGGLAKILKQYQCPVYGPDDSRIPLITHKLTEGDTFTWKSQQFFVWKTPGHTNHHLVFLNSSLNQLFCGDVLFGAGCGRNMEGQVSDLFYSLKRIAELPRSTQLFCAHEYTLSNLQFAQLVEPENPALTLRIERVSLLREKSLPSIPINLDTELQTNPFLRSHLPSIRAKLDKMSKIAEIQSFVSKFNIATTDEYYFALLRGWKNIA